VGGKNYQRKKGEPEGKRTEIPLEKLAKNKKDKNSRRTIRKGGATKLSRTSATDLLAKEAVTKPGHVEYLGKNSKKKDRSEKRAKEKKRFSNKKAGKDKKQSVCRNNRVRLEGGVFAWKFALRKIVLACKYSMLMKKR